MLVVLLLSRDPTKGLGNHKVSRPLPPVEPSVIISNLSSRRRFVGRWFRWSLHSVCQPDSFLYSTQRKRSFHTASLLSYTATSLIGLLYMFQVALDSVASLNRASAPIARPGCRARTRALAPVEPAFRGRRCSRWQGQT
jgi:hypothetical protein